MRRDFGLLVPASTTQLPCEAEVYLRHLRHLTKLTKKLANFLDLPLDFLLYLGCAGTLRISLSQRRHFDRYVCTAAFTERPRTWLFSP